MTGAEKMFEEITDLTGREGYAATKYDGRIETLEVGCSGMPDMGSS